MKLLIISDIHANWPALRAVLHAEPDVREILCLGDLVDYGPQPLRCVEWAINHIPVRNLLQGNHDWAVAWEKDPHCSPPYRRLARVTQAHCLRIASKGLRGFLARLSPEHSFVLDGAACFACHAAPSSPRFRYLPISAGPGRWSMEVERALQPDFLFVGHTHVPGKLRVGKTLVVNPGSVGQPKDGDSRAAYAVWDRGIIKLQRATYDVEETVRAYATPPFLPDDVATLAHVLRTGGSLPREEPVEATV
ncbi:MAG: metallophosphoesterase family protein [Candidatus Udaeobacter sp.]